MNILSGLYNRRLLFLSKQRIHYHRLAGASIASGVVIQAAVRMRLGISEGAKGRIAIAEDCELDQGTILDAFGGSIEIDRRVFIGPYCVLYGHGGISIGQNSMIAMQCSIVSANHTVPDQSTCIRDCPDIPEPTKIGCDVWLGAGVRVLAGVTIGDGCIVGAGSVVVEDLPPYSIAVGAPARVVKERPSE